MKILILGDCHGRIDLVHRACVVAKDHCGVSAAIQVGDFGFFDRVMRQQIIGHSSRLPIPLHVIDGNHEDHEWLHACRTLGHERVWAEMGIVRQPRGSVVAFDGVNIGFLGGALHADRHQEWPQARQSRSVRVPADPMWANWVTSGDVERALLAFNRQLVDLIVTHSCPFGIGVGMRGHALLAPAIARYVTSKGHLTGSDDDCGEPGLTQLWQNLKSRPPHWVFGHFHRLCTEMVDDTQFVCVGCVDNSDGCEGLRPVVYDTAARIITIDARPLGLA